MDPVLVPLATVPTGDSRVVFSASAWPMCRSIETRGWFFAATGDRAGLRRFVFVRRTCGTRGVTGFGLYVILGIGVVRGVYERAGALLVGGGGRCTAGRGAGWGFGIGLGVGIPTVVGAGSGVGAGVVAARPVVGSSATPATPPEASPAKVPTASNAPAVSANAKT